MMANHTIPRSARCIESQYGVDAKGEVVVCKVFEHTRQGHDRPMFYVLQYRCSGRAIDRPSRVTREFTGPHARQNLDAEMAETRKLFAESRERAARRHN
jgi:hypothetical protein